MTDTYTPKDIDNSERRPEADADVPDAEPVEHDRADDFDPGSPAADAPAVF